MSESERKEKLGIETPDETLNCQWVPRDSIEPNEWNPNEMEQEERDMLRNSIQNQGWTQPIVVHAEDMYIIDGEQRWTVAGSEEIQENEDLTPESVPAGHVPVFGITIEEDEAKVSTIQHNRAKGFVEYDSLYDYFEEFQQQDALDELSSELQLDDEQVLRIVEDQTVAGAIGEEEDPGPAWVPADISEFDDDEIEGSTRSKSLRESAGDDSVTSERIAAVVSPDEEELIHAVLTEENASDVLVAYAEYMDENDLIGDFWTATGVTPDHEEHPHPDEIEDEDDE